MVVQNNLVDSQSITDKQIHNLQLEFQLEIYIEDNILALQG